MQTEQLERIASAKRRKIIWRAGLTVAIAAFLALFIGLLYYGSRPSDLPGVETFSEVSRAHVPLNAVPQKPYNSNPPSSGEHYQYPANWDIYDYEVNDKIFIHNLEHGGIWISYRSDIPSSAVDQLKKFISDQGGSKLVMAPRSANDSEIAIASWTKVMKISLSDGAISREDMDRIINFYKEFKNRGPEFVPDTMPGIDPKSVQ